MISRTRDKKTYTSKGSSDIKFQMVQGSYWMGFTIAYIFIEIKSENIQWGEVGLFFSFFLTYYKNSKLQKLKKI